MVCVCPCSLALSAAASAACVRCGARRGGASRRSTSTARRQSAATDRAAAACRVRAGHKLSPPAGDVVPARFNFSLWPERGGISRTRSAASSTTTANLACNSPSVSQRRARAAISATWLYGLRGLIWCKKPICRPSDRQFETFLQISRGAARCKTLKWHNLRRYLHCQIGYDAQAACPLALIWSHAVRPGGHSGRGDGQGGVLRLGVSAGFANRAAASIFAGRCVLNCKRCARLVDLYCCYISALHL